MQNTEITDFLSKKYNTTNVRRVGAGSDSVAFLVDDYICRFSNKNIDLYRRESAVCNYIREHISINIPDIEICKTGKIQYARHKIVAGHRWSWHKFQFKPSQQHNLAESCARFFAQLHSVPTKNLPFEQNDFDWLRFSEFAECLTPYLTRRQLNMFERKYNTIIHRNIKKSDITLVHLGVKGPNSVVDENGNLTGVFDFCNCGVYERWRDLAVFYTGRNKKLYNDMLRAYSKLSKVQIDKKRIADVAAIEHFARHRWTANGEFVVPPQILHYTAEALTHFYRLPLWCNRVVKWALSIHKYFYYKRH